LRRKIPSAFEIRPEDLPTNPIESKHYHETIPFKRDISAEMKLMLYPADTFQINQYNLPRLEPDPEMEDESKEYGSEALVWYKPFHFYDAKWGIYIRWRGVVHTASSLYMAGYRDSDVEILTASLIKNAFRVLHSHAYFHFLVEWAASFMESLYGKPFYSSYVASSRRGEGISKCNLEEPLANAYALRQVDSKMRGALSEFFRAQPSPYREFSSYVDEEDFVLGKRRLGACIHGLSRKDLPLGMCDTRPSDEPQWEGVFNAEPRRICVWEVPTYWMAEPKPTTTFPQVVQLLMSGYSDRMEALKRMLGQAFDPRSRF
jgi:hypothetical protein